MNKEQLMKLFDEKFCIPQSYERFKDSVFAIDVKDFIFGTVIKEVLKSVIHGKLGGHTDEIQNAYAYGWDSCIDDIIQKAKEQFNIDL